MSVPLGNGDGSFQIARAFAAGHGVWSVAVADLDGDTLPDLVTANVKSDDASVLLNQSSPPVLHVDIDIKPGSCPNSYNRNSNGVLPVSVVGTQDFDVAQVDLATVTLSRAEGLGGQRGTERWPRSAVGF